MLKRNDSMNECNEISIESTPALLAVIGGDDGRWLREGRRRGGSLQIRLVLDGRVRRGRRPQTLGLPDLVQDLRRETAVHPRHPLVQVVLKVQSTIINVIIQMLVLCQISVSVVWREVLKVNPPPHPEKQNAVLPWRMWTATP